jgi:two-component system nitrogen regulation response regulator GlnG
MVIDDEPGIRWAFQQALTDDGQRVTVASSAEQGLALAAADPPQVVFIDVRLPGADGLMTLGRMTALCPQAAIIVMTAYGTVETAVQTVQSGAFDYLPKPFDLDQVRSLVERALAAAARGGESPVAAPRDLPPRGEQPARLVGPSLAIQRVFKQLALAAACDAPVLIMGESGTGKELVARAVHLHGRRAAQPFVAVHLAALPESLIERELFGHERVAFTGADAAQPGLLERAGEGTLFLDEVTEATSTVQAKLLRVLDGGDYRRVGGSVERRMSARVVAATNRDILEQVGNGSFRADLYYRLAVLAITIPPLRERPEDVVPLWDYWLDQLAPGRHPPLDPNSTLAKALRAHPWPGNVRELRNAVEHAARTCGGGPIGTEHLPAGLHLTPAGRSHPDATQDALRASVAQWARRQLCKPAADDAELETLHSRLLEIVEPPLLRATQEWAGGNQVRMARRLGLHRTTLREKLRKLDSPPTDAGA